MVDNFYSLSSSFNPWSTTDGSVAGMQLGDPESGLVIARRHDLLQMEESGETVSSVDSSSSIRVLNTLQEISTISSELNEIELEFHKQFTDREMADLIHTNVLRRRLSIIDLQLEHITSVVTKKDVLVGRLQSQAADNSIVIEAPYQRHATEVLTSLGSFVSQFPANCDKAKWGSSLEMDTTLLNKQTSETAQSILQCKADLQTSHQLQEIIK